MGRVVAFVPARGGSKSIPLKNIKEFCGKPLIYWSVSALQNTAGVDQVVVATDSDEIQQTVEGFQFEKVKVYRRLNENAQDTSSTESVILEYLQVAELTGDDTLMLVQITSPFTESSHFEKALNFFISNNYDSLLSCVRVKRFFWNEDGTSKNYDYQRRPRRQDFRGDLMENGAFYISKVRGIVASRNRLHGNIGIFEMPEYTGIEIDEPDDWIIAEMFMRRYGTAFLSGKKKWEIKLFLSDVDGVLTDAGMYYSETGDELKKFNTHDGMAFQLLREAGIKTGIITSEQTQLVERRGAKLKVDYLFQSKRHGGKLATALEICQSEGLSLDQVAYIGDDINCKELLHEVGVAACPSNAVKQIKEIPRIIHLTKAGGNGAVREFVDLIIEKMKSGD